MSTVATSTQTTGTQASGTHIAATSIEDVQSAVRAANEPNGRITPVGAGTKPALLGLLSGQEEPTRLDLRGLSGILEYEPGEYTFTARAGTPLAEIAAALTENGQYLPFDPPLIEAGATMGGTIGAGLSGSGRFRYGGLRDFLIGVRVVDGRGRLVRGGGKVVKNAAGFDLPKLMVGSMGRLGIVVEASFKVFPAPPARAAWQHTYKHMDAALGDLYKLLATNFDLESLDLLVNPDGAPQLFAQLGGPEDALPARIERIVQLIGGAAVADEKVETSSQERGSFGWMPPDCALVKVPMTVRNIADFDVDLSSAGASRRYIAGGVQAWIGWPRPVAELDELLRRHSLSGLVLRGAASPPLIGKPIASPFRTRLRDALDPDHCFLEYDA